VFAANGMLNFIRVIRSRSTFINSSSLTILPWTEAPLIGRFCEILRPSAIGCWAARWRAVNIILTSPSLFLHRDETEGAASEPFGGAKRFAVGDGRSCHARASGSVELAPSSR
jgi:hypothetical protein